MITHFQCFPLYKQPSIPGWRFTFYFQKRQYAGIYHPDGKIEWTLAPPEDAKQERINKQIHELMVFHVYDHV